MRDTPEERFWAKVDKNGPTPSARPDLGPCWVWITTKDMNGYGVFRLKGKNVRAHRFAYELFKAIPPKLSIDHLCRNRCCVNPLHLEATTHRENCLRGIAPTILIHHAGICKRGHALTAENVKHQIGGVQCKTCYTNSIRAWRIKHPNYFRDYCRDWYLRHKKAAIE